MPIEDVQTNLRLPSNLKEQLQASADASSRSLSAEATYRLAQAYELEKVVADMHSVIGSLQTELQTARNFADTQATRIRQGTREVAKLEQQLDTIKQSREADIAAAVQNYEERVRWLAERVEMLEKSRAQADEVSQVQGLIAKLLSAAFRRILDLASPEALKEPEVALGRALMDRIAHGGYGVASLLAENATPDQRLKMALDSYVAYETNRPAGKREETTVVPVGAVNEKQSQPKPLRKRLTGEADSPPPPSPPVRRVRLNPGKK